MASTDAADGANAGSEPELEPVDKAEEATPSSSSRFGALLGSASSLKKKASPFLSKAKQAIVEEAKQLTSDARDVAGGVREGMELTKQDLKEHTKGWRSAFGAKLRSFKAEAGASESKTTETKQDGEDSGRGDSKDSKLQALRQNLANTAKDVNELRQEVMDEVRLSVNDIRQVLRGSAEDATAATATAGEKSEEVKDSGDSGFNKVKASVFRKAGDLREGLRHRFEEKVSPHEAFWLLPSTQANYVQLNLKDPSEGSEAVNRVKKLGGKLKGSIAKKGREVSDGVQKVAQDLRQRQLAKKEDSKTGAETEDLNLGDSIFAIGSDEEDWSDGWEGSEGGHSETPSTRSASRAEEGSK